MSTFVGDSMYTRVSATHRSPLRSNKGWDTTITDYGMFKFLDTG